MHTSRILGLALLPCALASLATGQERPELNIGDLPGLLPEAAQPQDPAQREQLRAYLAGRRARLEIVATTVTDSGQVIDWIRPESQVPGGRLATPPPAAAFEGFDEPVPLELAFQPHAQGPLGTVPVPRRDLDEVLDGGFRGDLRDFLSKYGRANDRGAIDDPSRGYEDPGSSAHEYAYTNQSVGNFGGEGYINVWNPYVYKSSEFSLGQVAVSRAVNGSPLQTVECGWQDYKNLYGDNYPHLFVYYTTNGYASQGDNQGGYNRDVDGFVQYSSSTFPGARITWGSTYGGTQYSLQTRVQLYQGNWWIMLNNDWVGYYPATLFSTNGLRNRADSISWYGEIVDVDDGVNSYTDMGSGYHASNGWQWAAYTRNVRYYNVSNGYSYDYNPGSVWASDSDCYSIQNHALSGGSWGSYFWWGGPGKNTYCP